MSFRLLDDIPFRPDPEPIARTFGFAPDADDYRDLVDLLAGAPPGRPKACYREVPVRVEGSRVRLGDADFDSALLAENLAERDKAWLYVATCGRELHDWAVTLADPFERHLADEALIQALKAAMAAFDRDFRERHGDEPTAAMNPGSLPEWPITEQRTLFAALAGGAEAAGVALGESLLMVPNKSVSGVRFFNSHGYVNCRLCPRENCPNRRAPRDAGAHDCRSRYNPNALGLSGNQPIVIPSPLPGSGRG